MPSRETKAKQVAPVSSCAIQQEGSYAQDQSKAANGRTLVPMFPKGSGILALRCVHEKQVYHPPLVFMLLLGGFCMRGVDKSMKVSYYLDAPCPGSYNLSRINY